MNAYLLAALTLFATDIHPTEVVEEDVVTGVVHGAAHHGDVAAHEIAWSSSLLVRVEGDARWVRVPLARPLPKDVTLTPVHADAVVERDGEGRAVAVLAPVRALGHGGTSPAGSLARFDVRARQPVHDDGDVTLHAPLGAGASVQRITLAGATPLRFLPDDGLGIERRIGRAVGVDVSRDDRHRLDRWLHHEGAPTGERLYLRVSPLLVNEGLSGQLERAPAQRAEVALAAALAFGLLIGAGAWLYRRAAKQAELERVDALLEEELGLCARSVSDRDWRALG